MKPAPYPRYKSSGVEWLGNVPQHWEAKRLKFVADTATSGVWGEDPDANDEGVRVATTANIDRRGNLDVEGMNRRSLSAEELRKGLCYIGDIIVVKSSGSATNVISGKAGYVLREHGEVYFNNFTMRIRSRSGEADARFAWYFLSSEVVQAQVRLMVSTTTYPNLQVSEYLSFLYPKAPLPEQRYIADFLDRETARLDTLVGKKRELIEKLKEKRGALISRTVTRGLPPAAAKAAGLTTHPKLKPSRVEWLGDIPAHWKVVPFRTKVAIREGPGIMREDFREEGIPLLRIAGLLSGENGLEGCNYLDPEVVASRWNHFRIMQGDLILSASSSSATVHVQHARPEMIGAVPYTGLIRLWGKTAETVLDFVAYLFQSQATQEQLRLLRSGVGIAHFGPTHLKAIRFGFPLRNEQAAIAAYLDDETAKLDALVVKVKAAVEKLQEYRTALITAAVTGKIDVRGAANSDVSTRGQIVSTLPA